MARTTSTEKASGLAQIAIEAGTRLGGIRSDLRQVAPALALALGLRLFNLGERNTWYDEIGSILFAEKGLATIVKATAADTMPPLYYFLLHYWLALGNNLWTARALSVALSLGMVAMSFFLAKRLFGVRVAFYASLLVSVNPFQVYHGQEIRMYSLLGLSQLLAIYFFLRCLEDGGWKNWAGFALAQSVAMYTHNAAFLTLLTVDVFGVGLLLNARLSRSSPANPFFSEVAHALPGTPSKMEEIGNPHPPAPSPTPGEKGREFPLSPAVGEGRVREPRGGEARCGLPYTSAISTSSFHELSCLRREPIAFLRSLALGNFAIVVLFLPWLVYLPGQLVKVTRAFWTEPPGVAEVLRSFIVFTFNLSSPAPWVLPALLAVSLLFLALVVYHVTKALRDRTNTLSLAFAVSMFAGPVVLAILVSQIRPIYVERVLITSSVLYLILVAWMGDRLRPRFMTAVFFLPIAALTAWSLVSYYGYDRFPRAAFPQVGTYLEESVEAGDVVVHDNKLTFFPVYYLNRSLPQEFLADPDWSINDTYAGQTQEALGLYPASLEEATAGARRVWFIIFSRALDEAAAQGRVHENKGWLDRRFRLDREVGFGELTVYLYTVPGGERR